MTLHGKFLKNEKRFFFMLVKKRWKNRTKVFGESEKISFVMLSESERGNLLLLGERFG